MEGGGEGGRAAERVTRYALFGTCCENSRAADAVVQKRESLVAEFPEPAELHPRVTKMPTELS